MENGIHRKDGHSKKKSGCKLRLFITSHLTMCLYIKKLLPPQFTRIGYCCCDAKANCDKVRWITVLLFKKLIKRKASSSWSSYKAEQSYFVSGLWVSEEEILLYFFRSECVLDECHIILGPDVKPCAPLLPHNIKYFLTSAGFWKRREEDREYK